MPLPVDKISWLIVLGRPQLWIIRGQLTKQDATYKQLTFRRLAGLSGPCENRRNKPIISSDFTTDSVCDHFLFVPVVNKAVLVNCQKKNKSKSSKVIIIYSFWTAIASRSEISAEIIINVDRPTNICMDKNLLGTTLMLILRLTKNE